MAYLNKLLVFFFLLNGAAMAASGYQTTDSISTIPDTLLFRIQKAQGAIAEINAANKKGYGTARIANDLTKLISDIEPIKEQLNRNSIINKKNLLSYQLVLREAQSKLDTWQKSLTKYNTSLQQYADKVVALSNDSLLSTTRADSSSRRLYHQQVSQIKQQLQRAGEQTTADLDTVNQLLADVSANYADVTDLNNTVLDRSEQTNRSHIGKESPYIWAAPVVNKEGSLLDLVRTTFKGQNQILGYFLEATWDNRIFLLLIIAGFFFWVHNNFKKAAKPTYRQQLAGLKFEHLSNYPIFAATFVLLSLVPLFEPNSPTLYIELSQFVLLLLLTYHFRKRLDADSLKTWQFAVGLYISILFVSSIVGNTIWLRLVLIMFNLIALYLSKRFFRRLKAEKFSKRFIRSLFTVYVVFNALAILLNVFGRITLATTLSNAAIVAVTQVVTLAVFVQILSDAVELQIKVSAASGGLFSRINLSKTRISIKKMLTTVAFILWAIVLLINLSIAGGVFGLLHEVLIRPRSFGSMTFTLSNLLLFAVIIYVANMLQKYVGVLFGENTLNFDDKTEHKSSKLALVRLIIIFMGVMLAVAASGVPIEKLTVAIGALGVGIGLGLQNIVNNFVSGIILIFEKPFRIGDYIELADRKGKVQDIGIRSSKMLTAHGSEVIIPNGDLLSGRVVNWTLNNDYLKTQVTFKVNAETDLTALYKLVEEIVNGLDNRVKSLPPEILINSISADAIELKVMVWIDNIYIEQSFKSELLKGILSTFKAQAIKIL
jgi:potassium efflux system protein